MDSDDTPAPPGWYQDPWGPPGAVRHWSGSEWSQQVSGTVRFPEPAGTEGADADAEIPGAIGSPVRRLVALGAGGLVLALLVVTAVVVGQAGQDTGRINTPVLGTTFASRQVAPAQPVLEARLMDLEEHAAQDRPDPSVPVTAVDLTGTWWSAGASYTIAQYGAEVVLQEINAYGTTGVGYGVFDGRVMQIDYEAVDGSIGSADLTLVDADTLSAVFRNATHRVSSPAVLTRT